MREPGSRVAKARESDDAAVLGADAEPALSLERRSCHRLGYIWRALGAGSKMKNSARVNRQGGPLTNIEH
jgi:hypothetical protein